MIWDLIDYTCHLIIQQWDIRNTLDSSLWIALQSRRSDYSWIFGLFAMKVGRTIADHRPFVHSRITLAGISRGKPDHQVISLPSDVKARHSHVWARRCIYNKHVYMLLWGCGMWALWTLGGWKARRVVSTNDDARGHKRHIKLHRGTRRHRWSYKETFGPRVSWAGEVFRASRHANWPSVLLEFGLWEMGALRARVDVSLSLLF
jgi:hypothetical protein